MSSFKDFVKKKQARSGKKQATERHSLSQSPRHWTVTGKRGAAVRATVDIESPLVTVLAQGTAVVSAGSPTGLENGRIRLVSPADGFASVKVSARLRLPFQRAPCPSQVLREETAPPLPASPPATETMSAESVELDRLLAENGGDEARRAPPAAMPLRSPQKNRAMRIPADATLPLYYVNCDACEERRQLLEAQCANLKMDPRRVRATTPTDDAYAAAAADLARAKHMIPTDEVSTGAGANAIILSFLDAFRKAAEGSGDPCGIRPLVLGYPKNSSKFSTAVKSNSFSTILGPSVVDLEFSTTEERVPKNRSGTLNLKVS